jgi:hypothetical protein
MTSPHNGEESRSTMQQQDYTQDNSTWGRVPEPSTRRTPSPPRVFTLRPLRLLSTHNWPAPQQAYSQCREDAFNGCFEPWAGLSFLPAARIQPTTKAASISSTEKNTVEPWKGLSFPVACRVTRLGWEWMPNMSHLKGGSMNSACGEAR